MPWSKMLSWPVHMLLQLELMRGARYQFIEESRSSRSHNPRKTIKQEQDESFQFQPLPKPIPHRVSISSGNSSLDLNVIAFYAPGLPLTEWDRRTGGAVFGNFWPLHPHTITVSYNGASGIFDNSEAAYQSMKWWQHGPTRQRFEKECRSNNSFKGGQMAYKIKKNLSSSTDVEFQRILADDYDGLGKFEAMLLVLRAKWRLPKYKELLMSTAGMYMVEHCAVKGRDLYWTDDLTGGGENRLGAALMIVRSEILRESGSDSYGWPKGVQRPPYIGGPTYEEGNNWQEVVDAVGMTLVSDSKETGHRRQREPRRVRIEDAEAYDRRGRQREPRRVSMEVEAEVMDQTQEGRQREPRRGSTEFEMEAPAQSPTTEARKPQPTQSPTTEARKPKRGSKNDRKGRKRRQRKP